MTRRALTCVLALLVLVTPGCFGPGPFEEPRSVYRVCGAAVVDAPENATVVDASDRRIRDVESIRRAVDWAIADASETESGPMRCVSVNESEYDAARRHLRTTPLYRGDPHEDWGFNATGLYVAANGTVVRVELSESALG